MFENDLLFFKKLIGGKRMKRKFEEGKGNSFIISSAPPPLKIQNSYFYVKSIENLKKEQLSDELLINSLIHIKSTMKYSSDMNIVKDSIKIVEGFSNNI